MGWNEVKEGYCISQLHLCLALLGLKMWVTIVLIWGWMMYWAGLFYFHSTPAYCFRDGLLLFRYNHALSNKEHPEFHLCSSCYCGKGQKSWLWVKQLPHYTDLEFEWKVWDSWLTFRINRLFNEPNPNIVSEWRENVHLWICFPSSVMNTQWPGLNCKQTMMTIILVYKLKRLLCTRHNSANEVKGWVWNPPKMMSHVAKRMQ